MKKTVITIPSFVITTILYALAATTFFEIYNTLLEGETFIVGVNNADKDKTSAQESVETPCKSPCPPTAEMCIQMCA